MSFYSKYIIFVGCLGLISIPILMLDFSNLFWKNNRETYWGMIALLAMIGAVLLEHKASVIHNKIKDEEPIKKDSNNL